MERTPDAAQDALVPTVYYPMAAVAQPRDRRAQSNTDHLDKLGSTASSKQQPRCTLDERSSSPQCSVRSHLKQRRATEDRIAHLSSR